MGYYSDVAIQVYPKAYEELRQVWEAQSFPPHHIYRSFHNDIDASTIVYWHDVKWYDGYDHIDAIMGVVRKLSHCDDAQYAMQFLIVGEECGDVEIIANAKGDELCWDIYPKATIVISEDFKEV